MERLTRRDRNGIAYKWDLCRSEDEVIERLAAYEDTGLMPHEMKDIIGGYKWLELVNNELNEEIKKLKEKWDDFDWELEMAWEKQMGDDL